MQQEFIVMSQLLETGIDLASPHLRWLLRHAMLEHCTDKAVYQVSYCKDIPVDSEGNQIWGETFAPTRSIAINLEQHFISCIDQVQDEDKMYTSIRTLIIRELLDTIIHEAHHLKCSLDADNFANSRLEEDEAKKVAWDKSWMAAKHWDAEVKVFGPVLDTLMKDFIEDLREATTETPTMWKDLQVYMWDNELAFYNPDMDQECQIREAFESMAKDKSPWIDDPKVFMADIPEEATEGGNQEDIVAPEAPKAPETAAQEEQVQTADSGFEMAEHEVVDYVPPEALDITNVVPVVPEPPAQQPAPVVPPPPQAVVQPEAVPAPPAAPVNQDVNVLKIQKAVESVMRTLFVHVMSKCGFTTEGGYNNPAAVLEPISIHHIPDAVELFSHMDTTDATGVYAGNQPCQGMIKGLVSKQNLPMYRFYLNVGGHILKRTFIPQNPNKLNAHQELTKWAEEAREGAKIMMLLEDNKGPRAHIKLSANTPFGQEEFRIWEDK